MINSKTLKVCFAQPTAQDDTVANWGNALQHAFGSSRSAPPLGFTISVPFWSDASDAFRAGLRLLPASQI